MAKSISFVVVCACIMLLGGCQQKEAASSVRLDMEVADVFSDDFQVDEGACGGGLLLDVFFPGQWYTSVNISVTSTRYYCPRPSEARRVLAEVLAVNAEHVSSGYVAARSRFVEVFSLQGNVAAYDDPALEVLDELHRIVTKLEQSSLLRYYGTLMVAYGRCKVDSGDTGLLASLSHDTSAPPEVRLAAQTHLTQATNGDKRVLYDDPIMVQGK